MLFSQLDFPKILEICKMLLPYLYCLLIVDYPYSRPPIRDTYYKIHLGMPLQVDTELMQNLVVWFSATWRQICTSTEMEIHYLGSSPNHATNVFTSYNKAVLQHCSVCQVSLFHAGLPRRRQTRQERPFSQVLLFPGLRKLSRQKIRKVNNEATVARPLLLLTYFRSK